MSAAGQFFFRWWRTGILVISLGIIAYLLYFHRLQSLVPAYTHVELQAVKNASDWHHILKNPINAPFLVPLWFATAVLHHGPYVGRVIASVFGVLAVVLFYLVVRLMYGFRTTFLATILFATSAGLLHTVRLGAAPVLQFGTLCFVFAAIRYLQLSPHRRTAFGYGMAVLGGLLWYIPGMIWVACIWLFLMRRTVRQQLQRTPTKHLVGWVLLSLIVALPLLIAAIHTHGQVLLASTGLPPTLHSVTHIAPNLWDTLLSVSIYSTGTAVWWVGHAPLLNVAEVVLAVAGMYYYMRHNRTGSTLFIMSTMVLAWLLIGFGGSVSIAFLIPLIYLSIARGIDQLLERWFTVFPRNSIARFTGIAALCIMLAFSVLYQVRSYFVAWPHAAATRHEFHQKQ